MENKYKQNPIVLIMLLLVSLFLVIDVAISINGIKERSEIRENQKVIMKYFGLKPVQYDTAIPN